MNSGLVENILALHAVFLAATLDAAGLFVSLG